MELFPADDASVWEVIQDVLKDCDYYVLIVAGRYGSVDEAGISYTQREYEFAHDLGMPVAAFFHEEPEDIPLRKSEKETAIRAKLDAFKGLLYSRATTCGGGVMQGVWRPPS